MCWNAEELTQGYILRAAFPITRINPETYRSVSGRHGILLSCNLTFGKFTTD